MSVPVPYWRSDRDYYPRGDQRRKAHIANLEAQETINRRIVAASASGDASYAVTMDATRNIDQTLKTSVSSAACPP